MTAVFKDIKVVDFTWAATGPLITKYLADFGAQVVRVESILHPGSVRLSAPYKDRTPGINRSGYFAFLNGNKYDMALNLDHPRGVEVAKKLIEWADIVAESFAPGVMERYGLSYEDVKKINPNIIMFRTSTQGQTGPYANHPGFGYQAAGFAGFPLVTGWPNRIPLPIPLAYTDFVAFEFGASALIAALIQRKRRGIGVCLDLSQIEASLQFLSPVIMDSLANSREPARMGNSSEQCVPHGVYRCKGDDQWCAIAITSDEEWNSFRKIIGSPSWSEESRFSTFISRKQNEDALNKLIEEWTVNLVAGDIMNLLQTAGVPCGAVLDGEGLLTDPQIKSRGYYYELDHQEMGPTLTAGQPFKMSETPHEMKMPSPCLGEHTELVCKEMLKMSDEEFVELFSGGCFE